MKMPCWLKVPLTYVFSLVLVPLWIVLLSVAVLFYLALLPVRISGCMDADRCDRIIEFLFDGPGVLIFWWQGL